MPRCFRSFLAIVLTFSMAGIVPAADSQQGTKGGEWRSYGGDLGYTRYAPLDQINASNFNRLEVAWRFKTDQFGPRPEYQYEGTPLMVKGRLYITAGSRRAVVCLDAGTGELLWMHSENEGVRAENAPRQFSGHGVSYWTDGKEERILYVTTGYRLISLDAKTGVRVHTFGTDGVVDLKKDDDQIMDLETAPIGLHSTPTVAKNVVLVGAAMLDGNVPRSKTNVKGYVRAFDVRSGKRLWIFHTIPQPGEFGVDTWEKGSAAYTGNTGAWAQISVDEDLNMAYLPVELPTGDRYGGHRPGAGLFGESIVAVDLNTGKRVWHYQLVHHGLWDMDIPCAPMLVDFNLDGRVVKAVAQPTKQAYLYVLDRKTGKPIWPIEEKPVPQGSVPGEWYSPTQPIPSKPPAYGHQGVSKDDLIDFTPELRAEALKMLKDNKYELGPLFTPPVVSNPEGPMGVVISPAGQGGTNWPGGGYDPETHLLYVFSQTTSQVSSLIHPPPEVSDMDWVSGRAGQTPSNARPMGGVPASASPPPAAAPAAAAPAAGGGGALNVRGLPLLKPPYGILTAINLDKGDIAWEIAHGETPDNVRNSPELKGLNIPRTGRTGLLGPLVTKTLVIIGEAGFFTAANGQRGAMLHAYDKATGKDAGAIFMPAPQSGSPMTYMLNGQQYLAVAISGGNYSGELVVYKLPSDSGGSAAAQSRVTQPAQAGGPQVAASSAPFYSAAQASRGHAQYAQQCAVCHGQSLEGIETAPALSGPDFAEKWTGQSVGDLFERIRTTMPQNKPGSLSREAVADITAYLLSVNLYPAGERDLPGDTQVLRGVRIDAAKAR